VDAVELFEHLQVFPRYRRFGFAVAFDHFSGFNEIGPKVLGPLDRGQAGF
jgi:hypothetical protein